MSRTLRTTLHLAAIVAGVLMLSACETDDPTALKPLDDDTGPRILVTSAAWQHTVTGDAFQARAADLTRGIEALRNETRSGWTGRQDDVSGYLAELTGGRLEAGGTDASARARASLAKIAPLFGVSARNLTLGRPDQPDATGTVVIKAEQRIGRYPVLDGELRLSVGPNGLTAARGRTFGGLTPTATSPTLTSSQAARAARRATSGTPVGQRRLVYVTQATRATLAWEVPVVAARDGLSDLTLLFLDARSGDVVAARPGSMSSEPWKLLVPARIAGAAGARIAAQTSDGAAGAVELSGTDPLGNAVTGSGVRLSDGSVALIDTTTGFYDAQQRTGALVTLDAQGTENRATQNVVTSPSTTVADKEALAAHAFARVTIDYFKNVHGRASWDNKNGGIRTLVRFGDASFCNAMYSSAISTMIFGTRCEKDGQPQMVSQIEVDTAGHEIAHGVTATSADLAYVGQSGALNEAMSDYFGNALGDKWLGRDSYTYGEGKCTGFTEPTVYCSKNPDGSLSTRNLLNGATFRDYLPLLQPTLPLSDVGISQDHGGVHLNSAIWNNVMWTMRGTIAKVDGQPMISSPRVEVLDKIVYLALTRYLTPTSSFVDARSAIEQAARDLRADDVITRTIRRAFDAAGICATCSPTPRTAGLLVAGRSGSEVAPSVAGDRIAWVEQSTGISGALFSAAPHETPTQVAGPEGDAASSGMAGPNTAVTMDTNARVTVHASGAQPRRIAAAERSALFQVAGSDEGAAWVLDNVVWFYGADGQTLERAPVPPGKYTSIATGARTVALGDMRGRLVVWRVGSEPRSLSVGKPILGVAAHGDRVAVLAVAEGDGTSDVLLIDTAAGTSRRIGSGAAPLGIAMSAEYVVWPQRIGTLGGRVSGGRDFSDTALWMHSLGTGGTYEVINARGQQGFPAISGTRLAWQDTMAGGDDIYTGVLPAGL